MGFHVSSLTSLPVGTINYFVHVIDATRGRDGDWIAENLNELAVGFGANAGLVVGPANLSQQLYGFLIKNTGKNFSAIEKLLKEATCLLISEGHLTITEKPVYLLPIATRKQDHDDARQATKTLINLIAKAVSNGSLDKFVESLGAQKIELSSISNGMFICTLKHLNNSLELKPNLNDLGININAIIEKLLLKQKRSV